MEELRTIKFAVSALLQDSGEAARAIELARGLRQECPAGIKLEVVFFTHGSSFDNKIINDGFEIFQVSPELPGIGFQYDLRSTADNMVGDENLAYKLLRGEIEALREVRPDFFIHSFWPVAGIAAKVVQVPLEICYLPYPFSEEPFSAYLTKESADYSEPLTRLPAILRKFIMAKVPQSAKLKAPQLLQENLQKAYMRYTGKEETPEMQNLFDMLRADFTIINDLPVFYEENTLPKNFKVVGPLYAPSEQYEEVDIKILQHFDPEKGKFKIFCTLGNSGERQNLLEVIKALTVGAESDWESVVLCPSSVCSMEEANALASGFNNIYITDALVPALKVNSMADLVISHGGQGAVQTAIASSTPIIGLAVQPEQQINLDHVAMRGAAIRLPIQEWNAAEIQKAIQTIRTASDYKLRMEELKKLQQNVDGKKNSAVAIWNKAMSVRSK